MIIQLLKLSNYLYDSGHLSESKSLDDIIKLSEEEEEEEAGEIEEPVANEAGNRVVYNLSLNNLEYEVIFKQKSFGAPFDISFNVKGAEGYGMTGRGNVLGLLNAVADIVKDFIRRNPEVQSFTFTGAEESLAEGASEATKRTRVYNKYIERYLKKSPELKDLFRVGDLAWAGQPNTTKITKLSQYSPESNKRKKKLKRIGRIIILALRHKPEVLGLRVNEEGWVQVSDLLSSLANSNKEITVDELRYIVDSSDKQRFALSEDGLRIRANQGHSIDITLGYDAVVPPDYLYHGTTEEALNNILKDGIQKMGRHHVHLSEDLTTAIEVGSRRGRSIILKVESRMMHEDGFEFYNSDNNVWLTSYVPSKYIVVPFGDEV